MIVDGFSDYVRSQNGVAIMLGVVADNHLAYKGTPYQVLLPLIHK